jgi:hypothetical protein
MCLNGTCSEVSIGKYLSDEFPIQNYMNQGCSLLPVPLTFTLGYTIRKVGEKRGISTE